MMHDCRAVGCAVPSDCTCTILPGHHTEAAPGLTRSTLEALLACESCPAEQRALARLIAGMW